MMVVSMSRSESERTETAIQTDLPSQRTGADTTRSLGPTTLLKDTAIRGEDGGGRKESPATAMLLALSRPSRPISRSQSQVTVAGETGGISLEDGRAKRVSDLPLAVPSQKSSRRKRRSRGRRTRR